MCFWEDDGWLFRGRVFCFVLLLLHPPTATASPAPFFFPIFCLSKDRGLFVLPCRESVRFQGWMARCALGGCGWLGDQHKALFCRCCGCYTWILSRNPFSCVRSGMASGVFKVARCLCLLSFYCIIPFFLVVL
ncbi:hypothetical protein J3F83DRAFT_11284 [Trichoderma novae-zelandiae]